MKDHMESRDKRPQVGEKDLKSVYFPSQGFSLFPSVKTCPIAAPQRVLWGQVISGQPPQIRRIGGDPDNFKNNSLPRRRSQRHRHTPEKYCSQDTPCVGKYMPCGNDGIDARVEKGWRTSAFLHRSYEAQIGSPPFPHNRFENSFVRNPYFLPVKFIRRSFQQSLGKPCSVYVNSNRPDRSVGKSKPPFYHDGFPILPQGLLLLVFLFLGKGEECL
jgi:hypothetical protein